MVFPRITVGQRAWLWAAIVVASIVVISTAGASVSQADSVSNSYYYDDNGGDNGCYSYNGCYCYSDGTCSYDIEKTPPPSMTKRLVHLSHEDDSDLASLVKGVKGADGWGIAVGLITIACVVGFAVVAAKKDTVNGIYEKRIFITLLPIWLSSIIATLAASSEESSTYALVAWSFIAFFLVLANAICAHQLVKAEESPAAQPSADAEQGTKDAVSRGGAELEKAPAFP